MQFHKPFDMRRPFLLLIAALSLLALPAARADEDPFEVKVEVNQKDNVFETHASFKLPLTLCQAWKYITDYDDATSVPGVISTKSTRLEGGRIRVERNLRDTILMFPIRMHTVMDFTEVAGKGTDFVQVEGEAKAHKGSWRLESTQAGGREGTTFRYHALSEPDSALPMAVIRFFLDKKLRGSFVAMAQEGAKRKTTACEAAAVAAQ